MRSLACSCVLAWATVLSSCSTRLDPTLPGLAPDAGVDFSSAPAEPCAVASVPTSQYWICAEPASFEAAAESCRERNAVLARISSVEENAFLAAAAAVSESLTNLWIGGLSDAEYVWRWPDATIFWTGRSTGAAPAGVYANWKQGEPNDSSTVADEPERCAALTLFDTQWNDRACSLELSYVCERSKDGL
jgi:Lectin C-type domain